MHDARLSPPFNAVDRDSTVGGFALLASVISPAGLASPEPLVLLAIAGIATAAGAVNSIAGGGTLLTFPALVGLGIPPVVANATSTVALWPGAFGSMWGYRDELRGARRWAIGFAVPSIAGGALGATLLLRTPSAWFEALVPWLILSATALFMAQGPLVARARRRGAPARTPLADGPNGMTTAQADAALTRQRPHASVLAYQFLVGVYGGYFGAGVGILMLAALGMMGLTNIHRMNGLKNWGGLCMNATAAALFAFSGIVSWPVAAAMAIGAVLGGYGGSRMAQRVPQAAVRRAIVVIGVGSGVWMLFR